MLKPGDYIKHDQDIIGQVKSITREQGKDIYTINWIYTTNSRLINFVGLEGEYYPSIIDFSTKLSPGEVDALKAYLL